MSEINTTTQSFNENYKELKEIAEQLKNQVEPNIDQLIPQIERATRAYQICKERLKNVTESLSKMLPQIET